MCNSMVDQPLATNLLDLFKFNFRKNLKKGLVVCIFAIDRKLWHNTIDMDISQIWNKAQNYIKEAKFDEAMKLLNQAIEIEPKNANLLSERAVVFFHLEDKERALKELDYCVLLEPTNPYRYSSRAYVKAALRDVKGAIADYEKCVQLDPLDAIAYNNLGLLLESQGRIDQAKRNFNKADELEGVLKERGIDLPKEVEEKKEESRVQDKEDLNVENTKGTTWSIVRGTLTNRNLFKEYISFLRNGFKLNKEEDEE